MKTRGESAATWRKKQRWRHVSYQSEKVVISMAGGNISAAAYRVMAAYQSQW